MSYNIGGLNQGVGHCYGVGNGFHKLGFEILEYIQISTALHYVVCVYMGTVINKLVSGQLA